MVPQDATRAPLGHPWPSLSCHGQRRHVEDGRNPPPSAKLAHLVGRRHRAALRCLGLPGHARAEAAGGGGGEGRRVLPGLECLAQVSPHRSSPAHLAQVAAQAQRALCYLLAARAAPRALAPAAASRWRLAPAPAPPWPTPPSSSASLLIGRSVRRPTWVAHGGCGVRRRGWRAGR